jgi:steroid delta-isomerase-like uncharacterized protein
MAVATLARRRSMVPIREIADAWARAWEGSDPQAFAALFSDTFEYRDDQAGRVSRTPEELKAFHQHFAEALSEVKLVFTTLMQDGLDACLEWRFTGVHSGVYHGRRPTGRAFASPGCSVIRLTEDGKIARCTDYYDGAAVARQLEPGVP